MLENVIELLHALGFESVTDTDPLLLLVQRMTEYTLLNLTNLDELPEGLFPLAERMTTGEYLRMQKSGGQLEGFDLSPEAKDIKLGDTTVSLITDGCTTPEQRLDALIAEQTRCDMAEVYRYRRLVW